MDFPNLTGLQLQQAMPQPGQGAPELARRAAKSGDEQTLRKASQEFESIFVHLLLKEMRKGMPTGGVFERSMAREWFEGMMDDAVAKEVSKGPGIGLAGPIFDQMRQLGVKPAVQAGAAAAPAPKDEAPKNEEKKP